MSTPERGEMASMSLTHSLPSIATLRHSRALFMKPLNCTTIHQHVDADGGIMCEPCNGKGWLVCDFCQGQKTNVKAENKRIYRRCPSCKAITSGGQERFQVLQKLVIEV
ncbi:hypothetical protein CR513_04750, partial [Mucuna pruriens]